MPELPDVELYVEALERHVVGQVLEAVRLRSPFLVRSFDPPIAAIQGRRLVGVRRLGKRLVWNFEPTEEDAAADVLHVVLHLMIAGRLRWKPWDASAGKPRPKVPGRVGLAAFDFERGTLLLTEASGKKRASLHVERSEGGVLTHDRGGLEVIRATDEEIRAALAARNHTLKRALTDPRILSGIGNAYSDEILHRARLSPFKQTRHLDDDEAARLIDAIRTVLVEWTERLRAELGDRFPDKVTAFRPEMTVHGKHGEPCPTCGSPVQRIVYASNEANYCATCQTGGKLLADRALSQLLKKDWPKTLEELEERMRG